MTLLSTLTDCWLGLCRKTPSRHTASAVLLGDPGEIRSVQPDAGGSAGDQGRIRNGISIATASVRALFSEKRLLGFSFLSGLVILFLVLAERWNLSHIDTSYAVSNLITVPVGDSYLILFDLRLFVIEAVCLSGFTLLLAALVRYRNARNAAIPITVRRVFSESGRHAGMLAAFSITMALLATVLVEIAPQYQVTGTFVSAISMALFWLPYAYYIAPDGVLTTLFFSSQIVVANTVLFLLALYVVPSIVLEDKGFISAIAGSFRLVKKTWREILGCALVFGAIILVVACIGLVIGQSPALLNSDYDFFLQESRGQVLMMAACYGFLLSCGVLMALGATVLGIATTDLYAFGRTGTLPAVRETAESAIAEPEQ